MTEQYAAVFIRFVAAAARYPSTLDEFYLARLPGTFDESKAGKRMKLPVPETWETQVSLKGNKARTWQDLIGNLHRLLTVFVSDFMSVCSSVFCCGIVFIQYWFFWFLLAEYSRI